MVCRMLHWQMYSHRKQSNVSGCLETGTRRFTHGEQRRYGQSQHVCWTLCVMFSEMLDTKCPICVSLQCNTLYMTRQCSVTFGDTWRSNFQTLPSSVKFSALERAGSQLLASYTSITAPVLLHIREVPASNRR